MDATSLHQDRDIEIREAVAADRQPLQRMLELYQYDLSCIRDQDLDTHGEYGFALDRYWQRQDCSAFVLLVAGRYAGFALVSTDIKVGRSGHWMDQFFVLKKYRGLGLGQSLARHVLRALPGRWEVGQMKGNLGAQSFWRHVIGQITRGGYTEKHWDSGRWQGTIQCFWSEMSLCLDMTLAA